jgi:uncharacterized protein YodC (DUF2158 family)
MAAREYKALFEPGDLVRLRSGSPTMTVDAVYERKSANDLYFYGIVCVWFVGEVINEREFIEDALVEVDSEGVAVKAETDTTEVDPLEAGTTLAGA